MLNYLENQSDGKYTVLYLLSDPLCQKIELVFKIMQYDSWNQLSCGFQHWCLLIQECLRPYVKPVKPVLDNLYLTVKDELYQQINFEYSHIYLTAQDKLMLFCRAVSSTPDWWACFQE